jgi:hypothetical protein
MSRTDVITIKRYDQEGYRSIDAYSYSALAKYAKDRRDYYKKYVLGEQEESESEYLIMGKLVDVLMTDEINFDKYFTITNAEKPSGQLLIFTDELFKLRITDKNAEFSDLTVKAYEYLKEQNGGKLRDSYEKVVENFSTKAKDYFQELLNSVGKTVVTIEQSTLASECVKKINNCEAFKPVGEDIRTKFPIYFEFMGENFKCELDEMQINHKEKIIYPFDYKGSSFIETFIWKGFIDRFYFIQSSLYKYAVEIWKNENGMKDYKVENLAFKVFDSSNYYDPLLYKTTDLHYNQGFEGFYVGNKYYKGIFQLLKEIKRSKELDRWGISIDNFNSNGVVYIPDFEQKD